MFALDDILLGESKAMMPRVGRSSSTHEIELGIVDGKICVANGIVQHIVTVLGRRNDRSFRRMTIEGNYRFEVKNDAFVLLDRRSSEFNHEQHGFRIRPLLVQARAGFGQCQLIEPFLVYRVTVALSFDQLDEERERESSEIERRIPSGLL